MYSTLRLEQPTTPSELATTLGISRTTVTAAYNTLRDSAHLQSRRGAGSWTTLPGGARVDTAGIWSAHSAPNKM